MRVLYRPLWEGVQSSLRDIFEGGFPADKVIQRQMKSNRRWGSSDRKLFAESLYDIVRWWRRILDAAEIPWPTDDHWQSGDGAVLARATEVWCMLHDVEIDSTIESSGLDRAAVEARWHDRSKSRAVRESIPDWMDALGFAQLGEHWGKILTALNGPAPVYLRTNTLRTTREQLIALLQKDGGHAVQPVGDWGLRLQKRANVFVHPAFKQGLFEVQDFSSQQVAPALQVEPGMRVIDACAGAGGKSLHLAALMKNRGKIIALDVSEKKLEQLRERATRNGATSIEARVIESSKTIKRLAESADRVLLDVPCSGFGVLRRNPDSKWKLNPKELDELLVKQAEILASYASMCRPGGILVYATCSILPSENQQQVQKFLSHNIGKWTLEEEQTLLPEVGGADGFYFARLKRA